MAQVLIIGDAEARRGNLVRHSPALSRSTFKDLDSAKAVTLGAFTLVDVDLDDESCILTLKHWCSRAPKGAAVIFAVDKGARLQQLRANAIGATGVLHRPVEPGDLLTMLLGDVSALAADPSQGAAQSPGAAAGVNALKKIFASACLGAPIDAPSIQAAGDAVVGEIEAHGVEAWVEAVRKHHSQTYQHCLVVTGLATAFGQTIGASGVDRRRLSVAGMLHDIGKARVPVAILEKPGPLDDAEMALMRTHAQHGYDALAGVPSLAPEMLDMVLHHHEHLDGSGYPHGLKAAKFPTSFAS